MYIWKFCISWKKCAILWNECAWYNTLIWLTFIISCNIESHKEFLKITLTLRTENESPLYVYEWLVKVTNN